jgi:hypothetical protein
MQFLPDYTIKLNDGKEVHFLFNTWTFRGFCNKKGIELEDLFINIQTGIPFKVKDLPELLLVAAQSYAKYNSVPFQYTDEDACMWLDIIGGINSPELKTIYVLFVSKLVNVDPKQFEVLVDSVVEQVEKENKKKGQGKASNGARSTNSRLRQGLSPGK